MRGAIFQIAMIPCWRTFVLLCRYKPSILCTEKIQTDKKSAISQKMWLFVAMKIEDFSLRRFSSILLCSIQFWLQTLFTGQELSKLKKGKCRKHLFVSSTFCLTRDFLDGCVWQLCILQRIGLTFLCLIN